MSDQPKRHVIKTLHPDQAGIRAACAVLAAGRLVALPTETVYGLGADARDGAAVARIYNAKGRPSFNPLIVHVADLAMAERYVHFDTQARRLAGAFWPGPLTLVLPMRADAGLSSLVSAGLPSLAVRAPDHPVAQDLLRDFDGPIAAPSANPSGRISPTTAAHVRAGLGDKIEALLDGGACRVGLESSIVATGERPVLLRAGGIPVEVLDACLGHSIATDLTPASVTAPGQLTSHYAPAGQLRLNADSAQAGEIFLGFGPGPADVNLSPAGDLIEAAARLFDCLHQLDAQGAKTIAVAPIPNHGLGKAINDRLRRAAAPRNLA